MKQISPDLFTNDAVHVAKLLLGKVISYNGCSGMIVETEAYKSDPASHAYKITPSSAIMRDTYAHWYIYFIYGMYHCINITTNGTGKVGAVLIRAVEPLSGLEKMKKRRSTKNIHDLCSGPGKLCEAFGIDKRLNRTKINVKIKLYNYKRINAKDIVKTARVGITSGKELLWRFYIKENKFVSKK